MREFGELAPDRERRDALRGKFVDIPDNNIINRLFNYTLAHYPVDRS